MTRPLPLDNLPERLVEMAREHSEGSYDAELLTAAAMALLRHERLVGELRAAVAAELW